MVSNHRFRKKDYPYDWGHLIFKLCQKPKPLLMCFLMLKKESILKIPNIIKRDLDGRPWLTIHMDEV